MEKVTEDRVNGILKAVSKELGVDFELVQDEKTQRVEPFFDVNAMISKLLGLMVYCGLNVPSHFSPSYNRVHADVEWWKRHLEELAKKDSEAAAGPAPQEPTKT